MDNNKIKAKHLSLIEQKIIYKWFSFLINEEMAQVKRLISAEILLAGFYQRQEKVQQVFKLITSDTFNLTHDLPKWSRYFFEGCRLTEYYQLKYGLITLEDFKNQVAGKQRRLFKMKKINYGIVSTAQVVPRFIAGVRESQFGHVAAICSRHLDSAKEYAEKYQIPAYYGSEAELFDNPEIDVIYIANYNAGHFQSAKNALLARKHVLLEKPFTLEYAQAQTLFELAKEKRLFLMEAQKSLFLPLTKEIKKIISDQRIGEIISVFSVTAYASVDHIKWFKDLSAGGGTVHFMAPYAFSYLPFILDKKIESFNGIAQQPANSSDIQSMIHLAFETGILANIYLTTRKGLPKQLRIIGSKGEIVIPEFWRSKQAIINYDDGSSEIIEAPFSSDFQFEVDHVNQKIMDGALKSDIMTPELTLSGVKMMDSLYQEWSSQGE
jgi:predicted dehydrogenase